jgi:cytochrome P450
LQTSAPFFTQPYFDNVHDVMARLRADEPVCRATMPNGVPIWLITRYDDARAALTDGRLCKDNHRLTEIMRAKLAETGAVTELSGLYTKHMLNADPPDHTRLRNLLTRSFTARRVELLRPYILRIATELLDELAAAQGEVDLIAGFALPLPSIVIGELLGVPESDGELFQQWSSAMLNGRPEHSLPASRQLIEYLNGLIATKSDTPGDDLLSALAQETETGDRLSNEELVATAILLLVAGHETTANLIGNGAHRLLSDPELATALRARPDGIPRVVEELLRVDSPVMLATHRYTAQPVQVGDVTIPEGEVVVIAVGSANRDERRFSRPDELDVHRGHGGHVAFGHGMHYCLGAPLARLEAEVALGQLLIRFPDARIELPSAELRRRQATIMNGYAALPVLLGQ